MTERLPNTNETGWNLILNPWLLLEHNSDGTHKFTGTPTGAKFLRDDKVWATPPAGSGQLSWVNVQSAPYSAVGDGSTDDSAAIQAAIDSLPTTGNKRGGVIYFPQPAYYYKCVTALSIVGKPPIAFIGDPGPSYSASYGYGSTIGTGTASMTLVNGVDASLTHEGHTFRNINFRDFAGTSTLLSIKNRNRGTIRDCCFRDAAVGIKLDGPHASGDASWWAIDNCIFKSCTVGMDTVDYVNCIQTGGAYTSCGTCFRDTGWGNQFRMIGVKINGSTHASGAIQIKGFGQKIIACDFENNANGCINVIGDAALYPSPPAGTYNIIMGNFITGTGADTAITINVNAHKTMLSMNGFNNCLQPVLDQSLSTVREDAVQSYNNSAGICGTDFETGVNGVTLTVGGSDTQFTSILLPAAATVAYDNTHAYGALAAKVAIGATSGNTGWEWDSTVFGTQKTTHFGRMYVYFTAYPATGTRCNVFFLNTGTNRAALRIDSAGKLLLIDPAGTTQATSTNAVNLNAFTRIEWKIIQSLTAGYMEALIFLSPDSVTATETLATAANLNTAVQCNTVRFGYTGGSGTSQPAYWLDNVLAGIITGYPGPV